VWTPVSGSTKLTEWLTVAKYDNVTLSPLVLQ
jgi:hypothetical protein